MSSIAFKAGSTGVNRGAIGLHLTMWLGCLVLASLAWPAKAVADPLIWTNASPESESLDATRLDEFWKELRERKSAALLVLRHDRLVFERYAPGAGPFVPHYTASLAKALVGGLSLMLAIDDGRIEPDQLVSRFIPEWRQDSTRAQITVRQLATHTSGLEDAEADGLPHDRLEGWKGEFWKRLSPSRDPFSLARDIAPVLHIPGTRARYSNPGIAMLSYAITASLHDAPQTDLRALLKERILEPLGIPPAEWSVGYGQTTKVAGLPLVAPWGGGAFSPRATARIGQLLLHGGTLADRRLLSSNTVRLATRAAGLPNNSGLGWWVNREVDGRKHWVSAPGDAFWGAGAGHQFLLVVPSLDLVVVRYGDALDRDLPFDEALERYMVRPLMASFRSTDPSVHPESPIIRQIHWAPATEIKRLARGSDNWPVTWGDDDSLYTAFGDGEGFEPFLPKKLSLGFAKVVGHPPDLAGMNLPSPTGDQFGDGRRGRKASGLLMMDGTLFLWTRNATNAQLAWSTDHGQTWIWSDWRFEQSFGCPTFLNFGRDYAGARDDFVYVYSPDGNSAYEPADRFILARVPKSQIRSRDAYRFFKGLDDAGQPVWVTDLQERGAVFAQTAHCYRSTVSYDAGLGRYLWCQISPGGDPRFRGGFAIYDASQPWGPWTEAFSAEPWDVGPGETCSLPTKWMSPDGKHLWMIFSGEDSFSVRAAEIETVPPGAPAVPQANGRLRVVIETDAGGDPDDEQSLVRFLLFANEWDVEGIIANRPVARERENLNPERTGLGIVRAQLHAYAHCFPRLVQHDLRYPTPGALWERTVSGSDTTDEGVALILAALTKPDPRPLWFCNWGTDHGSASSNLRRALDRLRREHGQAEYARLKSRLRLSSADAFGEHTDQVGPPWSLWVDTFRPEMEGKRWYHRFSAITAHAAGFDLERDVRTGHGPLGALYPTNTTHPQKEGDTMSFLYLIPTGMNDVEHPTWGSWAGRYGLNPNAPAGAQYYWANQLDDWQGKTNRDNTLARWTADLQNDFRVRLDWCVKDYGHANHRPMALVNGQSGTRILTMAKAPTILLSAEGSTDPDGDVLDYTWWIYPEPGTFPPTAATIEDGDKVQARLHLSPPLADGELHVILTVRDRGTPPLAAYRRVIVRGEEANPIRSP